MRRAEGFKIVQKNYPRSRQIVFAAPAIEIRFAGTSSGRFAATFPLRGEGFEQPPDRLSHAGVVVALADLVRHSLHQGIGVFHGHAQARHLQHFPVVGAVAEGHGVPGINAQMLCKGQDGLALAGFGAVDLDVVGDRGGAGKLREEPGEVRQQLAPQLQVPGTEEDLHLLSAEVYKKQKDYDKGIKEYNYLYNLQPKKIDYATNLASLYVNKHSYFMARRVLKEFIKNNPQEKNNPKLSPFKILLF